MTSADGLRRSVKGLSEAEFRERFGTEAEAVRRLLDLGMEAVARGLLPAHPEGQDRPRSPDEGGAS